MRTLLSVVLTLGMAGLLLAGCCDKDCQCAGQDKGPGGDVGPGGDAMDTGPGIDAMDSGPGADADSGPGADATEAGTTDTVPPPKKVCPHGWCTIKAGTFTMGSPKTDKCREHGVPKETAHKVTLTKDIEMMDTEVTQADFMTVMGFNPSQFQTCGLACPAEQVTWHQAAGYCNKLSQLHKLTPCYTCTGSGKTTKCALTTAAQGAKFYSCLGYRLPTEAEWEYAYRAGTTSAVFAGTITDCLNNDNNLDPYAWYRHNSQFKTHAVGDRNPNPWGLHDMGGNVWEWCHDLYVGDLGTTAVTDPVGGTTGDMRIIRGGSWGNMPQVLRSANRSRVGLTYSDHRIGFRCVRTTK